MDGIQGFPQGRREEKRRRRVKGEQYGRFHPAMWVKVTPSPPTTFPHLHSSILTASFAILDHASTVKQDTGDLWGIQVEHWGNLAFRVETEGLDWCSHTELPVAVRDLCIYLLILVYQRRLQLLSVGKL